MIKFLLVTCSLEQSRADVLFEVIDNIKTHMPELLDQITVFDNASTVPSDIKNILKLTFNNVCVADRNVGYWSAIDWWLTSIKNSNPKYTYIIESDMIHYDFNKIWTAAEFLDKNPDIGSVRLHEYFVEKKHLYNKDAPVKGSKTNIWQSHTNKITGLPIETGRFDLGIYTANFLTQLPALNRYDTMCNVFEKLREMKSFSEFDFQKLYHNHYKMNSILNGGIFHCNPGCYGSKAITSSWTPSDKLNSLGYLETRHASIVDSKEYNVINI